MTRRGAVAVGELVHVQLAEHDRASVLQPPYYLRIFLWYSIREDRAGGGCSYACCVDQVLERDWHSM